MLAYTLRKGTTDPQVKTVKKLLNDVLVPSPRLQVDSTFDVDTERAVRKFQQENNLPEDGSVDPPTWQKLIARSGDAASALAAAASATAGRADTGVPLREAVNGAVAGATAITGLPETSGLSEEHKHSLYVGYLRKATDGGKSALTDLEEGKRVILGLRMTTNSRENRGGGTYDDRFVVLQDSAGVKTAKEFVGNTDPSSRYEQGYAHARKSYGEDADADGRKDLGRIPEGVYEFRKEKSGTYGSVLRPTSAIIAERDTNHDGAFDENDAVTNPAALSAGTSMLFHKGGNTITGSAGCQTMPPATFGKFWAALGPQKEFRYVLLKVR